MLFLRRRLAAMIGMLLLVGPAPALAQSVCLQLEAQLGALDRASNNSGREYQQLTAQYQRDRAAYDSAVAQADAAGCIARGIFRRNVPASCSAMVNNINGLQQNLETLSNQINRLADPNRNAAERNNVLRALANNSCGAQYAAYADRPRLIDRLFGTQPETTFTQPTVPTYRTLCVRACDGYYFPINYAATPDQFSTDALACQVRCPNQQVELYIHRNPGEGIEQAQTISGRSYTSLPAAYAYRDAYNPDCGCGPPISSPERVLATIGGTADQVASLYSPINTGTLRSPGSTPAVIVPFPVARPEPSEDPETLANRAGGLSPAVALGDAIGQLASAGPTVDDGIRRIGPAYYYAQ